MRGFLRPRSRQSGREALSTFSILISMGKPSDMTRSEWLRIHADVDKGGQRHVAAYAAEAIEMGCAPCYSLALFLRSNLGKAILLPHECLNVY